MCFLVNERRGKVHWRGRRAYRTWSCHRGMLCPEVFADNTWEASVAASDLPASVSILGEAEHGLYVSLTAYYRRSLPPNAPIWGSVFMFGEGYVDRGDQSVSATCSEAVIEVVFLPDWISEADEALLRERYPLVEFVRDPSLVP